MDHSVQRHLELMRPAQFSGHLGLFLDLAPQLGVRDVPDPYDEGPEGFELTLDLIERGSEAFAAHLAKSLAH
jgi:protein-tyrosine phosphatase